MDEVMAECSENGNNQPEIGINLNYSDEGNEFYGCFSLPEECWPEDYDGFGVFTFNMDKFIDTFFYDGDEHAYKMLANLLRKKADEMDEYHRMFYVDAAQSEGGHTAERE